MKGESTHGEDRAHVPIDVSPDALRRLIDSCEPAIAKVIAAHFRRRALSGRAAELDEEDLRATARLRVLERLQAKNAPPITDLPAYAARVAHVVWAEHCRARQPERTRFLDQVRYFIENDASDDPVARWDDEAGVPVCGFAHWRGKRARAGGDLSGEILEQVEATVARRRARTAVRQLLRLAGSPIAVAELYDLLGGMIDEPPVSPAHMPEAPPLHSEVFHRENLRWLWGELSGLPRRQRIAFLLHAPVVKEFEYEGIASIREVAALLELDPQQLASWWFRIPLDDHSIAAVLSVARQEVINLRKAARIALGRRLAIFFEISSPGGERET